MVETSVTKKLSLVTIFKQGLLLVWNTSIYIKTTYAKIRLDCNGWQFVWHTSCLTGRSSIHLCELISPVLQSFNPGNFQLSILKGCSWAKDTMEVATNWKSLLLTGSMSWNCAYLEGYRRTKEGQGTMGTSTVIASVRRVSGSWQDL